MFQIGDIITGKKEIVCYCYTNHNSICQVTRIIDPDFIEVEIVDHKTAPSVIGGLYDVESKYFTLLHTSIQLAPQSNDDFMEMLQ